MLLSIILSIYDRKIVLLLVLIIIIIHLFLVNSIFISTKLIFNEFDLSLNINLIHYHEFLSVVS